MKFFLDSNICIYFLKGVSARVATRLLACHPDEIRIASMVRAELLYGAERSPKRDQNLEKVRQFLLPFEVIGFGKGEADRYATIRAGLEKEGTPIGPNDLVIAATVLEHEGVLVTNNEREFRRVQGLEIQNWTK